MLIFICFGLGYGRMRDSKIRVGVGFGFFRGDYIIIKNKKDIL